MGTSLSGLSGPLPTGFNNTAGLFSGTPYYTTQNTGLEVEGQPGTYLGYGGTGGQTLGTSTYSSGGGGYAAPTVDPAILAQYDQAIANTQAGIDRLPTQLNSGLTGVDSAYQDAMNALLLSENQGKLGYDENKQTTSTGYVGAKNTIGSQAGEALNGLMRLLGSRGAGGSLAARGTGQGTIRGAVGRGATIQRADAGNTFAGNMRGLDQEWGNFMTALTNQRSSAGSQRDQSKQNLTNQVDTNRASLLQSLATLQAQRAEAAGGSGTAAAQPYLNEANAILDRTSNYTVAPINYQTQAYKAPELASYNPQAPATAQYEGSGPSDYISPYLQTLLGKKQQPGLV